MTITPERVKELRRHFDKWVDCPASDISDVNGEYLPCPKCEEIRAILDEYEKAPQPGVTKEWVEAWAKAAWKGDSCIHGNIYAILRELGVKVEDK